MGGAVKFSEGSFCWGVGTPELILKGALEGALRVMRVETWKMLGHF